MSNCLPRRGRITECRSVGRDLPAEAFIRSVLIVSNSGRFCCRAVLMTDSKTAVARAPRSLRLPPVIFRIATAGRRARSAALLLALTPSSHSNTVSLSSAPQSRNPIAQSAVIFLLLGEFAQGCEGNERIVGRINTGRDSRCSLSSSVSEAYSQRPCHPSPKPLPHRNPYHTKYSAKNYRRSHFPVNPLFPPKKRAALALSIEGVYFFPPGHRPAAL